MSAYIAAVAIRNGPNREDPVIVSNAKVLNEYENAFEFPCSEKIN